MNLLHINKREIGLGKPAYVVAELSANHGGSFETAAATVRAMKEAGADAVKVQTYTADTLTIACDAPPFQIGGGTLWDGKTLHALYAEACMPWEWQPKLSTLARDLGLDFFSSPFDDSAVEFLERLRVPAYKIASFELVDLPLIRRVAQTGKPLIISTGMATTGEIEEALRAAREAGAREICLLKCTSAYPASPKDMNLLGIAELRDRFDVPAGISDHTLGSTVPIAAVALGACIIEKHFILSRDMGGPDAAFSMEPDEFKEMAGAVRMAEQALGTPGLGVSEAEAGSRQFRRSLFVVKDIKAGDPFTGENVRSIRPGGGLHTRHLEEVLGKKAARDIRRGTPLEWSLVAQ
jgi:pseudaminic acid synthase